MTSAFGNAHAPVLTLSLRLNRVSSADAAAYSARSTSGSPALLMRPCTSIEVPTAAGLDSRAAARNQLHSSQVRLPDLQDSGEPFARKRPRIAQLLNVAE